MEQKTASEAEEEYSLRRTLRAQSRDLERERVYFPSFSALWAFFLVNSPGFLCDLGVLRGEYSSSVPRSELPAGGVGGVTERIFARGQEVKRHLSPL